MATEPTASDLAAVSDADLQALIAKLSAGHQTSDQFFGPAGVKTPDGDYNFFSDPTRNDKGIRNASLLNRYNWRKKGKRQRAKYWAMMAARAAAFRGYADTHKDRLEYAKKELEKRNKIAEVNKRWGGLETMFQDLEKRTLDNSLAQIADQTNATYRNTGFQTAAQGLAGSSVDAERQALIQQSQQQAAIAAAANAQRVAQSARSSADDQRQSLVDVIGGGNPYNGQVYEQQLRQVVNETSRLGQQQEQATQLAGAQQYGYNLQSQAMGGLLGNIGSLYSNYYNSDGV